MNESTRKLCDDFVEGKNAFKSKYWYESSMYAAAASLVFVTHKKPFDIDKFIEAKRLVNSKFGIFSNFRSEMKVFTVANIAVDSNMESKADKVKEVYSSLKGSFSAFLHGEYLPLAAFSIADNAKNSDYDSIAIRSREIYKMLQKDHPLLTSSSDIPLMSLMALSGLSDEVISEKTNEAYAILKSKFPLNHEAVQQLSFILTLLGCNVEESSEKIIAIKAALKSRGIYFGFGYETPVLGLLAALKQSPEEIADNVAELDDYIKHQRKMNFLYISRGERRMYAAALYALSLMGSDVEAYATVAAATSTITNVIIQEIIFLSILLAASAARSASSSSN